MGAALAMMVESVGMDDDRLEWHLWNWEQWQNRHKPSAGLGYPNRGLSGMGRSYKSSFEDLCEAADARCAKAVEAILGDLPPAQRCAVHAIHLHAVFRFPRLNLQACYDAACERVRAGLTSRGIL